MNEISQWLSGERDYTTGVALFEKYAKNKALVRTFRHGNVKFWQRKLEYEMGKLVPNNEKLGKIVITGNVGKKLEADVYPSPHPNAQKPAAIPTEIMSAKKEIADLYNQIDIIHSQLYETGTSNDTNFVSSRKRLLDKRKPMCVRVDLLYRLKEEYFRTTGDDQREVLAELKELTTAEPAQQPSITTRVAVSKLKAMKDIDLLKRKQALATSITKTHNMLQYQSLKKLDTSAPLPPGPKRDKYERKLAALKLEYKSILQELKNR